MRRVQMNKVMYLGGHPDYSDPIKGTVLVVDDGGIHLRQLRERFVIPWGSVAQVDVEGPEQASRRVTMTRLVGLGIFAFAAKKRVDTEAFLYVATVEGAVVGFQIPKTTAAELRAKLHPWTGARRAG